MSRRSSSFSQLDITVPLRIQQVTPLSVERILKNDNLNIGKDTLKSYLNVDIMQIDNIRFRQPKEVHGRSNHSNQNYSNNEGPDTQFIRSDWFQENISKYLLAVDGCHSFTKLLTIVCQIVTNCVWLGNGWGGLGAGVKIVIGTREYHGILSCDGN